MMQNPTLWLVGLAVPILGTILGLVLKKIYFDVQNRLRFEVRIWEAKASRALRHVITSTALSPEPNLLLTTKKGVMIKRETIKGAGRGTNDHGLV